MRFALVIVLSTAAQQKSNFAFDRRAQHRENIPDTKSRVIMRFCFDENPLFYAVMMRFDRPELCALMRDLTVHFRRRRLCI